MKWQTYWLHIGTTLIASVLLPVGATDIQVKQKALSDLDIIPALAYPRAPFEQRASIGYASVRVYADSVPFERSTPEKYWGFIPEGLLEDPPNQPECPWVTRQRECDAARERVMARRKKALWDQAHPPEDLGPAI